MGSYTHTYLHTHTQTYIHTKPTYWYTYTHTYLPTYIYTYIHTYIHTYIQTYILVYVHTHIHTYVRTYLPTYIHTYIQTYILVYIHTYIPTNIHIYIHKNTLDRRVKEQYNVVTTYPASRACQESHCSPAPRPCHAAHRDRHLQVYLREKQMFAQEVRSEEATYSCQGFSTESNCFTSNFKTSITKLWSSIKYNQDAT